MYWTQKVLKMRYFSFFFPMCEKTEKRSISTNKKRMYTNNPTKRTHRFLWPTQALMYVLTPHFLYNYHPSLSE